MTTKTKVCLIFSCLTPRVKECIHHENFIFVSKGNDFSFLLVRKSVRILSLNLIIINIFLEFWVHILQLL